MILNGYRHGLRASELCDLWRQRRFLFQLNRLSKKGIIDTRIFCK
jgi:uncharacterized protein YjiS (DUF1127 family)